MGKREIEPTHFSHCPLPCSEEHWHAERDRAVQLMRDDGVTWFRITEVSETYPNPPYPHAMYIEGWKERPEPKNISAPFRFPLVAAD